MLLGQSLVDAQGKRNTLLLDRGQSVRVHEFHWSAPERGLAAMDAAYVVDDRQPATEGLASGQTLASYLHVHFGADGHGDLARRFVQRAAAARHQAAHAS